MYTLTSPSSTVSLSSTQITLITLLVLWELVWKGLALWRAGRNNQKVWFVLLLVVNSLGVLDIVYLFLLQPKKNDAQATR